MLHAAAVWSTHVPNFFLSSLLLLHHQYMESYFQPGNPEKVDNAGSIPRKMQHSAAEFVTAPWSDSCCCSVVRSCVQFLLSVQVLPQHYGTTNTVSDLQPGNPVKAATAVSTPTLSKQSQYFLGSLGVSSCTVFPVPILPLCAQILFLPSGLMTTIQTHIYFRLLFTTALSQWEILVAFLRESQLQQSHATYSAYWVFQCFLNPLNPDTTMGSLMYAQM